jgi:hypothetical protein
MYIRKVITVQGTFKLIDCNVFWFHY